MGPRNNETWTVESQDAKRALAADKYDDCLACRVTGMQESSPVSQVPRPEFPGPLDVAETDASRFCGLYRSRRLQLLLGHAKPAAARSCYPEECEQV